MPGRPSHVLKLWKNSEPRALPVLRLSEDDFCVRARREQVPAQRLAVQMHGVGLPLVISQGLDQLDDRVEVALAGGPQRHQSSTSSTLETAAPSRAIRVTSERPL